MKQVNVLLSSYNGEKYILEQIESILNQSYPNIKLYIRDDGSTDGTVGLLKKTYTGNKRVVLLEQENIGYGKSFFSLLNYVKEGDFWAFSDQDDIWMPQKIEWAVNWMEHQDEEMPLLFHSSFELVSEDLSERIGVYSPPLYEINFRRALTDSVYQGFSITMNRALRELLLECDQAHITSHDWMAGLVVEKFGKAHFDERIAVKHRRLTTSASSMELKNRIQWFFKAMSGKSDIRITAKEFVRVYANDKFDPDFRQARWFAHDTYYFPDVIKKVFYPGRWRQSWSSEFAIRVLMCLGKI